MKREKSNFLPFIGICAVLFFLGAFAGYLCNIFFLDIPIKNTELSNKTDYEPTYETEDVFINKNIKETSPENNTKTPTILSKEDIEIEKASKYSDETKLKNAILTVLKNHITLDDLSISKIKDGKYKVSAKIPDANTIIKYIPSLKNYKFFVKPFVGKDFIAYINTKKQAQSGLYNVEIEKIKADKFTIKKSMIKNFVDFTDFEININNFS